MKAGIGSYAIKMPNGLVVAAIVAVNAVGDIIDPTNGQVVAGVRGPDRKQVDRFTRDFRDAAGARAVVIDVTAAHFWDISGVGALDKIVARLRAQGVAVDNWADDNFDHSQLDFIGGGNMWVYSDKRPIGAASMSTFGKAPQWGAKWKAFVKENADRWNLATMQKTTLP